MRKENSGGEKGGEGSIMIMMEILAPRLLPVDRLTTTDCNAATHAKKQTLVRDKPYFPTLGGPYF